MGPRKLCVSPFSAPSFTTSSIHTYFNLSNQYPDNVVGPGSQYDNAYFEIKYVRVYGNGNSTITSGANNAIPTVASGSLSSNSTRSAVGNFESLWLVWWVYAVAVVIRVGLILS